MGHVLNIDVAIGVIKHAFSPLACVVEVYDYQSKVRIRVFGADNRPILSVLSISMRDVVNPSLLRAELQQARSLVETKGFTLMPWRLSSLGM